MIYNLRAERVNRGLSLDALAAEIDVPKSTLARVEKGGIPTPATQLKIAEFYGVLPTEIWPVEEPVA